MEYLNYLIPVIAISVLCAIWIGVQFLAKHMGTKNHIDGAPAACGLCGRDKAENCSKLMCPKDNKR